MYWLSVLLFYSVHTLSLACHPLEPFVTLFHVILCMHYNSILIEGILEFLLMCMLNNKCPKTVLWRIPRLLLSLCYVHLLF